MEQYNNKPDTDIVKVMEIQQDANRQYNLLMEAFAQQKTQGKAYPAYYAGSYIDAQGDLVVLVTDNAPGNLDDIRQISGNDRIKTKLARHPYNDLNDLMDTINKFLQDQPEHPVARNIGTAGLSDTDNLIEVGLLDCREEQIQAFRTHCCDHIALHFEQLTGTPQFTSIRLGSAAPVNGPIPTEFINPGKLITKRPSGRASASTRCYRNYGTSSQEVGFLTAAHFANLGDQIYGITGQPAGVCTARNFGGTADAAFIRKDESALVNNTGLNNAVILGQTMLLAANASYISIGGTTGYQYGTVTLTNGTLNVGGQSFSDLYYTSGVPEAGDSGGLMYILDNRNYTYQTGIVLGKYAGPLGTSRGIYTKMPNALRALNATLY